MQDDILAALGIENDLRLFKARDIVLETAHGDRAGRMETVAIGDVAGNDAVDHKGNDLRFVMFGAEQADDGLQRAHPAQALRTLAFNASIARALRHGGRAGAHGFRPGERADDAGHHLGDDLFRRAAGFVDDGDIEIALLRIGNDLRFRDIVEASAAQKALDGLFIGIGARPLLFLAHIGGAGVEAANIQCQTARRPVFARTLIGKPSLHKRVGDEFLQIASRLALHAGGDFLGAEFKQKIRHGIRTLSVVGRLRSA
ncbi:hypothetical protein D3C71_580720 [compost metagenome]